MSSHLEMLGQEFRMRFADLLDMTFPEWFAQPCLAQLNDVEVQLQEEMAGFKADIEAQSIFKHKGVFVWFDQCVSTRYPRMCKKAEYFLIPFPTNYLVESAFCVVNVLLTKMRNRLDVTKR